MPLVPRETSLRACSLALMLVACRTTPTEGPRDGRATAERADVTPALAASTDAAAAAPPAASAAPPPAPRAIGPFEVPFEGKRNVYYVAPRRPGPARLLANLHGVCNPPGYACGYWVEAAAARGFLVCPEGNSRCGGAAGPPTWTQPVTKTDADLERAVAAVEARHPGEVDRGGAVLTGFSLGAWAAVRIARAHPARWPYLVLTEADVPLDAKSLRAAGVRAVALIAGEKGTQIGGMRRTAEHLARGGFPARFWVMRGAGHHYSADIDAIMAEALDFVLAEGDAGAERSASP